MTLGPGSPRRRTTSGVGSDPRVFSAARWAARFAVVARATLSMTADDFAELSASRFAVLSTATVPAAFFLAASTRLPASLLQPVANARTKGTRRSICSTRVMNDFDDHGVREDRRP